VPIDPSILDEAGIIAYDEALTTDERRERLEALLKERPELEPSVAGYVEMLSMEDSLDEPAAEGA
jgi:hypothetical protein